MIGFLGTLALAGLFAWGLYLYYKVEQLNRKIAQHHRSPLKMDDDNQR